MNGNKKEGNTVERLLQEYLRKKKQFLYPALFFLFVFYFSLPLTLAYFPDQMNQFVPYIGLTWGWLYTFLQFIVTFTLAFLYMWRARELDRLADEMKQEEKR